MCLPVKLFFWNFVAHRSSIGVLREVMPGSFALGYDLLSFLVMPQLLHFFKEYFGKKQNCVATQSLRTFTRYCVDGHICVQEMFQPSCIGKCARNIDRIFCSFIVRPEMEGFAAYKNIELHFAAVCAHFRSSSLISSRRCLLLETSSNFYHHFNTL